MSAARGIKELEDEIASLEEEHLKTFQPKEQPKEDDGSFIRAPEPKEKPLDGEEESWKKRYGDLRRHSQKQEQSFKEQIADLQETVNELKTRPNRDVPPTNPDEVKAWVEKYPQVAAIISALAEDQAKKIYEPQIEHLKKETATTKRDRELASIYKAHEDFDEIKVSDQFHDWVEGQPEFVQNFVYKGSADQVVWAVSSYKNSLKTKPDNDKEAARQVGRPSRSEPAIGDGKRRFSESEIENMSGSEYASLEKEIQDAIREGRLIYDISGAAR